MDDLEYPRYPDAMKKILVSVDERLLALVDRQARREHLSRSAYLALLVRRGLDQQPGRGHGIHVRRAMSRLDKLFASQGVGEEATAAVRGERDAR